MDKINFKSESLKNQVVFERLKCGAYVRPSKAKQVFLRFVGIVEEQFSKMFC